jgi:hypothetical protein
MANLLSKKVPTVLELCWLKQAWAQMSDNSMLIPLDHWNLPVHVFDKLGLAGVNRYPSQHSLTHYFQLKLDLKTSLTSHDSTYHPLGLI